MVAPFIRSSLLYIYIYSVEEYIVISKCSRRRIRKYFRRDAGIIMTSRPRDATMIGINQPYILGKNNCHFMRASAKIVYIVT